MGLFRPKVSNFLIHFLGLFRPFLQKLFEFASFSDMNECLEDFVKWDNGEEDIVFITDLVFQKTLTVFFRSDPNWRGNVIRIFDSNEFEVTWTSDGSTNTVTTNEVSPLNLTEFYGERVKWRDNTSIVGTIHPPRNLSDPLSPEENPRSRFYASSDSSASSSSDGTVSSDDSGEPHHSSEQIIESSEQGQSTENSDEMRSGLMRWTIKQDPEVGDFPFEQELDKSTMLERPWNIFLSLFATIFAKKFAIYPRNTSEKSNQIPLSF